MYYSPLKRHLYRAHIIPSKNCANQRVIPSAAPLLPPHDYIRKLGNNNPPLERFKNSHSLPQLKNIPPDRGTNSPPESPTNNYFPTGAVRPYTPPEKRYNANFGVRQPPPHKKHSSRPRSCVYENVHVEEELFSGGVNRVRSDKGVNYTAKGNIFPAPEFSRMYIQENFE